MWATQSEQYPHQPALSSLQSYLRRAHQRHNSTDEVHGLVRSLKILRALDHDDWRHQGYRTLLLNWKSAWLGTERCDRLKACRAYESNVIVYESVNVPYCSLKERANGTFDRLVAIHSAYFDHW